MNFKTRLAWRFKPLRSRESLPFIPWLRDRGSLTAKLQARGKFAVRLLRQCLAMPTLDEATALSIKCDKLVWLREVALLCDGVPVVFAHTVLPYRPRGSVTIWLARLGDQSLGAMLFARPGFSRGLLNCKQLDSRHALFSRAIDAMQLTENPPATLWARRSLFVFANQSVLVTEVFSPSLICK